jgi:hypothetical protein
MSPLSLQQNPDRAYDSGMMSHLDAILDALFYDLAFRVLALAAWAAVSHLLSDRKYGVRCRKAPVFENSLQSRISSTDASMTLVANSVRGGSTISGYQCFTIDRATPTWGMSAARSRAPRSRTSSAGSIP